MRRYAYGWLTLAFFLVSIFGHWLFGWFAYLDDARTHHEAPQFGAYAILMARDTFENWQSEFLQLIWQVAGLAYFLYVGSPSSKEGDDRLEAKLDALLELVGREKGLTLIREIDESHERRSGHARILKDPPYGPLDKGPAPAETP